MRWLVIVMLVACGKSSEKPSTTDPKPVEVKKPANPIDSIELPVITDGFEPSRQPDYLVVVSTTGIALGDKQIVAMTDGVVDASEREGGALGLKIPRLVQALATAAGTGTRYPMHVAIDRRVPYRTMMEVLYSAKQAPADFKEFELLAKQGSGVVQAPIKLPERRAASASEPMITGGTSKRSPGADLGKEIEKARAGKIGGPKPDEAADRKPAPTSDDDEPVLAKRIDEDDDRDPSMRPAVDPETRPQLAVAITKDDVVLWSISGLEGTLRDPKLRVPLDGAGAAVRAALVEIATRRWAGKERDDHSIILMADGATPMQRIIEMIGAVRATADRKPLFHDIMFASGFE